MNLEELVKFIDEKFNDLLDFKVQFNNIRLLLKKIEKLDDEFALELINNSKKLSASLEYLYKNQTKWGKDRLVQEYFDDSLFATLLEVYCENNKFDIYSWLDLDNKKLLFDEELYTLIERAQAGDEKARDMVINCNMGLVKFIASKYAYIAKKSDFDDLCQEGVFGLIKAIEKYNKAKSRFSTYAVIWIRQAISRYLAETDRPIRYPAEVENNIKRVKRAEEELLDELHVSPTPEAIAKKLDWPVKKVKDLISLDLRGKETSLDKKIGEDKDSTLSDIIVDEKNSFIEDDMINRNSNVFELAKLVLRPKEYEVICYRFGKFGRIYRLEEVGKIFKVSRERIRQIEAKALARLRTPMYRNMLDEKDSFISLETFIKENTPVDNESTKLLFEYFPDYSEDEVIKALSKLADDDKDAIYYRFGRSLKQVKPFYNLNHQQRVTYSINKIESILSGKHNDRKTAKSIDDYFAGYSKEYILEAVKKLSCTDQEIFFAKFGKTLNEANVLSSSNAGSLINRIIPFIRKTINDKVSFYDRLGLSKEETLRRIELLTPEEREDLYKYLGYDLDWPKELPLEKDFAFYVERRIIPKIKSSDGLITTINSKQEEKVLKKV